MKPPFSPCCDRSCVKMADSFADLSRRKDDRMIKQLLNSVMANTMICLCLALRQIIYLLVTDKSRYFAQPRPIIVNWLYLILLDVMSLSRRKGCESMMNVDIN